MIRMRGGLRPLVLAILAICCTPSRAPERLRADRVDLVEFHRRFRVLDSLRLEEPRDVITVNPMVHLDPAGGFFLVENGEEQIRVYSPDGHLRDVVGQGTGTTDSLLAPTGVDRLRNGDLVATSLLSNSIAVIHATTGREVRRVDTPLRLLEGVTRLSDDRLLLTGPDAPYAKNLLHIWDYRTSQLVSSSFPPPRQVDSNVVLVLGRVYTAIRNSRIAAIHSLSDTVFVYDTSLTLMRSFRVPVDSFVVPSGSLPAITSLAQRREWMSRWALLSGVHWLDDSHLVIQWSVGRRGEAVHGLTGVDTSGRRRWSVARSPKLLAVRDSLFFFQSPASATPERWTVASLTSALPH